MDLKVLASLKTGHLIRQLHAVSRAAEMLARELEDIPTNYCEVDGEYLRIKEHRENTVIKVCPKCNELYLFPYEQGAANNAVTE
jgi:hypothetical protein